MTAALTSKQIGKRIVELRKMKGYSQEDLAKFLEIPGSSVAQTELGNRNFSVIELIKLSDALGFSLDKFLSKDYKQENKINYVEESSPVKENIRVSTAKKVPKP